MPCPICKCETAMTVCPNCGGNTNHYRYMQSMTASNRTKFIPQPENVAEAIVMAKIAIEYLRKNNIDLIAVGVI